MFHLLRHRAVAQTENLAKAGVVDLDPLSVAERSWNTFVATLDQHLKASFATYADPNRKAKTFSAKPLADWDRVYCWVAAAQRQTLQARRPGQLELDLLMLNLDQAADPTPSEASVYGWDVGYHAVEAATALTAKFDRTAAWHLDEIRLHNAPPRAEVELSADTFDPAK